MRKASEVHNARQDRRNRKEGQKEDGKNEEYGLEHNNNNCRRYIHKDVPTLVAAIDGNDGEIVELWICRVNWRSVINYSTMWNDEISLKIFKIKF